MKALVGVGIGQAPSFDHTNGILEFSAPLDKLKIEQLLLVVNVTKNKIVHSSNNANLVGTMTPNSGIMEYEIAGYNIGDYDASDVFHCWVETGGGSREIDFLSDMALRDQHYAISTDLKLEAGNDITFSFDPTNLETNIQNQTTAINEMKASIDKLLEIPDTAIIDATSGPQTKSIDPDYIGGGMMVSVRNLTDAPIPITLTKDSTVVLNAFSLLAKEYIDMKFDEILVDSGSVQVTFSEQLT